MESKKPKHPMSWGQFRFSVIGSLLASPPPKGQLGKQLQKLASESYLHPINGRRVRFAPSTIERWYYRALGSQDPVKALGRKIRSDLGKTLTMTSLLSEPLRRQYALYPHWSYQLHRDNLAALVEMKPQLGQIPSYSTVLRYMKGRGWIKRRSPARNATPGQKAATKRLETREVRSFESKYVHALWHLDYHEARRGVVDSAGRWHRPFVLCILDDRSRLCCHAQWYLSQTAETLFHGLMQAFHKRGLPRSLMSDNGSAMIATETENGLSRLGIVHEKTLPYSPYQNGKQEAFWGQLEGRLMAMLSRVKPLTLDFLNRATQAWVEQEYNRSLHEEIGSAPIERMLQGPDVCRPSPDTDTLRLAFTVRERRSQRKSDGTIAIKAVRFELPSRFAHFQHLYVRYQSWDLTKAYLVDPRNDDLLASIYPQDKAKNANGYRHMLQTPVAPSAPQHQADQDPIPPLLRKILSDYAATGLPPAYLPMEPVNKEFKEDTDE
jgi:transposase InsO family protein